MQGDNTTIFYRDIWTRSPDKMDKRNTGELSIELAIQPLDIAGMIFLAI